MDILWVIDNSGSMDSSQQNVAANFQSFMNVFQSKSFDYQMAVTTSDAYKVLFGQPATMAKFKDGTDWTSHTGVFMVKPTTVNPVQTFVTNALQGIYGSGDERVFQSIKSALDSNLNAGFMRSGSFLSVIIVSDEDDFSWDGSSSIDNQYNNPSLHTVNQYVSYLDALTHSTPGNRTYNVNAITILDQACLDTLNAQTPGRKIGQRYIQMANATGGITGSLCGNFGQTLAEISNKIVELSTRFKLNREPVAETIQIWINGVEVPRNSANGFTYDSGSNSVIFHGSFVPPAGATISVRFDPATLL